MSFPYYRSDMTVDALLTTMHNSILMPLHILHSYYIDLITYNGTSVDKAKNSSNNLQDHNQKNHHGILHNLCHIHASLKSQIIHKL